MAFASYIFDQKYSAGVELNRLPPCDFDLSSPTDGYHVLALFGRMPVSHVARRPAKKFGSGYGLHLRLFQSRTQRRRQKFNLDCSRVRLAILAGEESRHRQWHMALGRNVQYAPHYNKKTNKRSES
jgi:hypothetical protein